MIEATALRERLTYHDHTKEKEHHVGIYRCKCFHRCDLPCQQDGGGPKEHHLPYAETDVPDLANRYQEKDRDENDD